MPEVIAAARAASPGSVESIDAEPSLEDAFARLDDALLEHRTVIVSAELEARTLGLLLEQVDRAIVLAGEDDRHALPLLGPAEDGLELVLAVDAGNAGAARRSGDGAVRTMERSGASGPGGLAPGDVAWLGRHVAATKLGLALGAGGAKGYAHVGALQVLEEAGYTIDYAGGSSIGAIVGSYVALGKNAGEIDATLRDSFTPDTIAEMFKLSLSGQSTGRDTMCRILRETTGDRSFEDTADPVRGMAVDLTDSACRRRCARARSGRRLSASTALAGMFPPLELDGHRLVDGLALVPVPTGAVIEDGADVTVSVNLMSRDTLPAWPGQAPPEPEPQRRRLADARHPARGHGPLAARLERQRTRPPGGRGGHAALRARRAGATSSWPTTSSPPAARRRRQSFQPCTCFGTTAIRNSHAPRREERNWQHRHSPLTT